MTVALAAKVLAAWGAADGVAKVAERENAVYRARLDGARDVALRLHRPGYRARDAICAELEWTTALADAGVRCPRPVRTASGAWLADAGDGRVASVVSWVEGRPLTPEPERFQALGDTLARFHGAADALAGQIPTAALPRWDAAGLLGDTPIWGRFWESPALSAPEQARLAGLRDLMRATLGHLGEADTGLIHADVLADNVLDDAQGPTLIDFDDCGIGYRGYDLGTALVAHADRAEFPALSAALVQGYAARRGRADGEVARHLPLFVALRAAASCAWADTRTPQGDPRRRSYAARALKLCAAWADGAAQPPQNGSGAPLARIVPSG